MEDYLRVGVIISTHGLAGEVKVYPTTDDIGRFKDLTDVVLKTKKSDIPLKVERARQFKNIVILKFAGVDSIDSVISWKGCDLMVSRENAVPLAEGEYYIADILGCRVICDDGRTLGKVKDVLETGANDVLIVDTSSGDSKGNAAAGQERSADGAPGRELLIPWIDDCMLSVDLEKEEILVHLLDGLEEP